MTCDLCDISLSTARISTSTVSYTLSSFFVRFCRFFHTFNHRRQAFACTSSRFRIGYQGSALVSSCARGYSRTRLAITFTPAESGRSGSPLPSSPTSSRSCSPPIYDHLLSLSNFLSYTETTAIELQLPPGIAFIELVTQTLRWLQPFYVG
jgi:hypothetical protein